ncbi:MAG TPA: nitrate- and nitrite sensing domain-containing protein [Pseudonocardiaceae bacterium]
MWESLAEWRNWRLPVKVAAVLVVPVIAAVALGAIQIRSDIGRANSFANIQKLIQLRDSLIPLTNDLQTERWLSAEKLGTKIPVNPADLHKATAAVDRDVATVTGLGQRLLDPQSPAGVRYQGLIGQFGGLNTLHQQAFTANSDVITVISSYGQVINAALDLDQALTPQLADPQLTGLAISLNDVDIAQEQIRVQQTIVAVGITRGSLLNTELQAVQASDVLLTDRLNDFQIGVGPAQLADFQQQEITDQLNVREQLAQQVLSNGQTLLVVGGQGMSSLGVPPGAWITASDSAGKQLTRIAGQFAGTLKTTSADLQDQASSSAGIESVVLFAILLLAIGVGVVVGRHLLRSLGILRRTALDVAEYQLPAVVASIDRGETTDLAIDPVAVHTHEELGQLARAFDAVHGQAVRSAVGQANLRSNLRSVFVNLSRRSQSLVERQLRLMERLERNEENPQQLANLFKLDHLATRMRRNNENLMVLSGDDPTRRSGGPLPLADVVRAAVSEIEHYQRVVVRSTPSAAVLGYAAGDLTRLIAELLDNATSFSPPESQVSVGGRSFPDGSVRIEIRDDGIGMAADDLVEANARLDAGETPDVPVSRQMGLYVVGRLARRHSIRVVLETPTDGGLIAVVQVPTELIKPGVTSARPAPSLPGEPVEVPSTATRNGTNGHANGTNGHGPADLFGMPTAEPAVMSGDLSEWAAFTGPTIRDLAGDPNLAPTDFTWFVPETDEAEPEQPSPSAATPAVPAAPEPASHAYTSVGLPRRIPRSHAVPGLVEQQRPGSPPPTPAPAPTPAGTAAPTARRNPSRARGFLNDYQSGVRQGARQTTTGTPAMSAEQDNGNGEDR